MAGAARKTTDHEGIKSWVEERDGRPSLVKGTGNGNGGVLRISFPGYGAEGSLEEITWEEFFRIFDDRKLAFLHQDKLENGQQSRFFKFISR